MGLPEIPLSAPFSAGQRLWLNGYLAALFSETIPDAAGQLAAKERVLILYASQSGNSEALAESFGEQLLQAGFDVPVLAMDAYRAKDLSNEKTLIIITSTWGEGDPPDNAVDFWTALSADDYGQLDGLRFAVLGLGDTNYLDFCAMGRKFDQRLEALGARRIAPRGDCDTDYEETASRWFATAAAALGSSVALESEVPEETLYSKQNPYPAKLLTNRFLNALDADRDTRHFEFSLEGSGLSYEVGDVLGVYPKNDPEMVDELIASLKLDPNEIVDGITFRETLIERYDIRAAGPGLLKAWPVAVAETDQFHELIDLVEVTKPTFTSATEVVSLLRKLGPRLYSISSSPKAHPNEVHLTVAKVDYECDGRLRKGVCSTYLAERVKGGDSVSVFLQTAKHFKIPSDPNAPVIMIGPGTGIAPFRAFLEERAATSAPGKNWLFFGNPHKATDWLYRDELEGLRERGFLHELSLAWSRDQETKVYVQDRMREDGDKLWSWLEAGAYVYVCGDAKRMAKDVDAALHDVISAHSDIPASDYVSGLKAAKRYQRDVY